MKKKKKETKKVKCKKCEKLMIPNKDGNKDDYCHFCFGEILVEAYSAFVP